jgi:hypothetical protein
MIVTDTEPLTISLWEESRPETSMVQLPTARAGKLKAPLFEVVSGIVFEDGPVPVATYEAMAVSVGLGSIVRAEEPRAALARERMLDLSIPFATPRLRVPVSPLDAGALTDLEKKFWQEHRRAIKRIARNLVAIFIFISSILAYWIVK